MKDVLILAKVENQSSVLWGWERTLTKILKLIQAHTNQEKPTFYANENLDKPTQNINKAYSFIREGGQVFIFSNGSLFEVQKLNKL